jgi:SAM-dependent methyltransferase
MSGVRARVSELLPPVVRDPAATVFWHARALRMRGDAVICPCCGHGYSAFIPNHNGRMAQCPGCGSMERHRLLWLWLAPRVRALPPPVRVLHVAPEPSIRARLLEIEGVDYISIDLEAPDAMLKADVTDLPFRDGWFGLVLCNHVLEHVPDDRAALAELRRVTAPGGLTILQTPWDPRLAATDEDPGVTDPAERVRRFGQDDHVRRYGADFPDRLRAAGYDVELDRFAQTLGPEAIARHGLDPDEEIVACTAR